ncbi:hypothetical protein L596_022214 [Steinernema carpocapsae]|uniref:Uncharacterized protein n=1 Tax=Steinernema carpocapsae TaxID=34508 RepID=A0A4U5ML23_STECR|nr:hypothetical protein L596_022214 [Steinernema carpocapsae]
MIYCLYATIVFIVVLLIATCFPSGAEKTRRMAGFDGSANVNTVRCATSTMCLLFVSLSLWLFGPWVLFISVRRG